MNKPFTIWFTGLSGSGKSTLAINTFKYLKEQEIQAQILDGDVLRSEIGGMFGYTREERIKAANVYRLMAKILNRNGVNVIVAAITPFKEMRIKNRKNINNYIEVYVHSTIEECIRRDVKGLYEKALNGEEKNVIGIDLPYDDPLNYNIKVNTEKEKVEESLSQITLYLNDKILSKSSS